MLTTCIIIVVTAGMAAIVIGVTVAIKGNLCHAIALYGISYFPLNLLILGVMGWVLLPTSRSDPGILPGTYFPFLATLSALSVSGLLAPLTCGMILIFRQKQRQISLRLIGVVGLAVLFLVFATIARVMRIGVF